VSAHLYLWLLQKDKGKVHPRTVHEGKGNPPNARLDERFGKKESSCLCQELLPEIFGLVILLPTPSRLLCCGRSLWECELKASWVELYFKNRNLLDDLNVGYSVMILTGKLYDRYRRTHIYSGAVIHFIFKLQPHPPLVMRHAFGARVRSPFMLQCGTSFLPF
jgi:hypothetical protein